MSADITLFYPRLRYAMERALERPGDYLACECCGRREDKEEDRARLRPASPVPVCFWQLWCEAGGIVNVRDLWQAFAAIVVNRKEDEDEVEVEADREKDADGKEEESGGNVDERMVLALFLFYRGLAELRMTGFVKGTKRKADCLAKTAWRGL
jgi:origin recognition complex subunit 3